MGYREVKFRKTWQMNPIERVHSTPKGKKQYDRNEGKKLEKNWQNERE